MGQPHLGFPQMSVVMIVPKHGDSGRRLFLITAPHHPPMCGGEARAQLVMTEIDTFLSIIHHMCFFPLPHRLVHTHLRLAATAPEKSTI